MTFNISLTIFLLTAAADFVRGRRGKNTLVSGKPTSSFPRSTPTCCGVLEFAQHAKWLCGYIRRVNARNTWQKTQREKTIVPFLRPHSDQLENYSSGSDARRRTNWLIAGFTAARFSKATLGSGSWIKWKEGMCYDFP